MKTSVDPLERLLRSAAEAPERGSEPDPFLVPRAMAAWRASLAENPVGPWRRIVRFSAACAAAAALISFGIVMRAPGGDPVEGYLDTVTTSYEVSLR
jgi:hypothetical protein